MLQSHYYSRCNYFSTFYRQISIFLRSECWYVSGEFASRAQLRAPFKQLRSESQKTLYLVDKQQKRLLTTKGMGASKAARRPKTVLDHLNVNFVNICVVNNGKTNPITFPIKQCIRVRRCTAFGLDTYGKGFGPQVPMRQMVRS